MLIENAIVIPARLESTRLPKKLLLEYKGKPLIQHAVEQALESKIAEDIILLSDSHEIINAIDGKVQEHKNFSYCIIPQAENGTHRLQQFIRLEQGKGNYFRNIVLLQADIIGGETGQLADTMFQYLACENDFSVYTFSTELILEEENKENIVKLLTGKEGYIANYFTRKYVPGARKHIGIYGFSNVLMNKFEYQPTTYLTQFENLEQMYWIEAGRKFGFINIGSSRIGRSIDTKDDYDALCRNA